MAAAGRERRAGGRPYLTISPPRGRRLAGLEAEDAKQTQGDAVASFGTGEGTGEARWSNGHYVTLDAGDAARLTFSVPTADSYYLYAAYLKQQFTPRAFAAEALHVSTPPAIDGRLDEWQAAQPLSATQTLNILRGAAGWGGADKDSFVGYLTWDAPEPLCRRARLFAPRIIRPRPEPRSGRATRSGSICTNGSTARDRAQADAGPDARRAAGLGLEGRRLPAGRPNWPGSKGPAATSTKPRCPGSAERARAPCRADARRRIWAGAAAAAASWTWAGTTRTSRQT